MGLMTALSAWVDSRLAQLPRSLTVEWPGGRVGSAMAQVRLKARQWRTLAWLASGRVGPLAEAYVNGQLDIEGELSDVMAVAAALVGDPVRRGEQGLVPHWWRQWHSRWRHREQRDAEGVRFHYDVCDAFYGLWLDPQRVYSCAYYDDGASDLAAAQCAKLDLVCRKLLLAPGQRLLDIGAGWGALLFWAAEHYGVQAVGITLSAHQHAHVNRLIDEKGLRGQVDMRLLDYRQLPVRGEFDRVASIGMFEHVGRARLDAYFARLSGLVRPGGLVLNHGITASGLHNDRLGAGMGDFIEKHIFPGGELVHVSQVAQSLAAGGLELLDAESLRPHYARTLWDWSAALERQLDLAQQLTSSATVRAYRLYLAGSAMCFERGWLSLYQLLAARPGPGVELPALPGAASAYPYNRAYMYR
jgi:cyclopropane-fatty-acyl-phospholipid synthase